MLKFSVSALAAASVALLTAGAGSALTLTGSYFDAPESTSESSESPEPAALGSFHAISFDTDLELGRDSRLSTFSWSRDIDRSRSFWSFRKHRLAKHWWLKKRRHDRPGDPAIPEPSAALTFGVGLLILRGAARRRRS